MSRIAEPAGLMLFRGRRRPYRMSVEKYEAMVASGVFSKHDHFELIEGMLVEKMTKGERHATASEKCGISLARALPAGWHVRHEQPVRIPRRSSEPEPDLSVARGEPDDYVERHPGPEDVALIVEVADSSVEDDRDLASTYAGGGVPAYWIVNLVERRLEVYADPAEGAYPAPRFVGESESVELVVGGRAVGRIAVADLLPRRAGG